MDTLTEKQLPVNNNLMEVESPHLPPENILNEELEIKDVEKIKNVEKMKFSNWLTIQLRKKFQGRFSKVFYTG